MRRGAPGELVPVATAAVYLSRSRHRGLRAACDDVQDLVDEVKRGDRAAIEAAADVIAAHPRLRSFDGDVIGVPRSSPDRPPVNDWLAEALVERGVGRRSLRALERTQAIESSRERRLRLGEGVPYALQRSTMAVVAAPPRSRPLLLVDDVLTSGATLLAAAEALQEAGARGPIRGAVLAYAERPERAGACPIDYKTVWVHGHG